jgi:hypothetical protein
MPNTVLSNTQLDEICRKCGITCLLCEQGYFATLDDVTADNPDYTIGSYEAKRDTIDRMLMDTLDFGPYNDKDDLEEDKLIEAMEERDRVLDVVVPKLVNGEYSGQEMNELELAQTECVRMTMPDTVGKYSGADVLEEIEERQWVPGKDYDYTCLLNFLAEEGEDSNKLLDDKLDEYENLDGSV